MINKRILTLITLLLFLLLVVGCDVIKPNQPPVITSDPVETATVGVDYTYNVVAIDPNAGDVLTYSLTTEPEGMLVDEDSGVITWIPDAVEDFDVVVVVSDEDGLSDSQDFTITVGEFVVELVGIEVDPEEMTLYLIDETVSESFKVTAHYNDEDTKVVTPGCVYGIDDISIVTVADGTVTASKVGTATISINYTEGGITKGATLPVIVKGKITIRWLESAIRYNADGSEHSSWDPQPIPNEPGDIPATDPATLIPFYGGYYFADPDEFFNYHMDDMGLEGSIVISGTGQLSGWATYSLYELPTKNDFAGQVEMIIYEEVAEYGEVPFDGTMVGTYTQLKYAYAESDDAEALAELEHYTGAFLAPEIGPDWWFVQYTDYTVYEWEWE